MAETSGPSPTPTPMLNRTRLASLLVAGLLGLASSCATPAISSSMTVGPGELQDLTLDRLPRAGSLALRVEDVQGGMGTHPMGTSEIAAEDFARALAQSLRLVGLHAGPDMEALPVHVQLLSVLHPPGDQDLQTYLTVRYRVYPHAGGEALFDRTIRTGHTVPMRAVPTLKGRQRAAIEGAARKNIATFIGDISEFGPGS